MVCSVEEAVRQVEPALQSEARTRAIGALSKLRNARTSSMSLLDKEAMKRLQNNKAIVILPADKGNATVVMNRNDYVSKMTEHLEDETTYSKIDRDPTRKTESELQKLLTDVFKFVPPEKKHLYNRLLCHTGSAPAIYGLPKIHKPNVPLRPIVDYTRSPLHSLSGYLHSVLRPLVGRTSTYVKDSADFVDKIRNVTLDCEDIMVSFDVKSMFTRIPVDYAVDCCRSALKNDDSLPARTPLEADDVCRLLDFCLRNTYFSFNGSFYKQVFGTAMGASVSVSCANIALEALEEEALATFQPAPKLFLRYVDDCFSIIRREDVVPFLEHLNSFQSTIEFTVEEEVNGRLAFLDVDVARTASGLSTSVYRKPTHTGKYLHFDSAHPIGQKRSVATSLFNRAYRLCSTSDARRAELKRVTQDLIGNGYPSRFIKTEERRAADPSARATTTKKRASLPYARGVSESLSRIFQDYEVKVCHIPSSKLKQQLVRVKDRLEKERYPGVVYKIPCQDCQASYIGETGNFKRRLQQHRNDVAKRHTISNALAEHSEKTGHCLDWQSASIIEKEKKLSSRLLIESFCIQSTTNTINRTRGPLPEVYASALRLSPHI